MTSEAPVLIPRPRRTVLSDGFTVDNREGEEELLKKFLKPKRHQRYEVSTSGVDDALVGFTSDPYSQGAPQSLGLRIPAIFPNFATDTGPAGRPRFLFCLATRTTRSPTKLVGLRQGVTLGVDLNHGTPPFRPIELPIGTPGFKFPDGNISWHLVIERNAKLQDIYPLTDTVNWRKYQSDSSAMLYQSFTNTLVQPSGAPILYMRGLTAYQPPQVQQNWQAIEANLSCFYDLRFPWVNNEHELEYELDAHCRISLYASVLQSNPSLRTPGPVAPILPGTPCEEAFISSYTLGSDGPIYWRIYGSLIFQDLI
jgi:hypothetical protein